jgi:hypothetical protein
MAIDLATEHVVSLNDGAKFVPPCRDGKPCHPTRLLRAIVRGDLEGLKFGPRGWATSIEAIQRWGERLADAAQPAPAQARTPRQRRRDYEKAEADLDRRGVGVTS